MALAAVKTFVAEVLTSSDLNTLNTNILNNPTSLISPFTGNVDIDGYDLTDIGELEFRDEAAMPTADGRLRRNSDTLYLRMQDARTNSVNRLLALYNDTTGSPAAGIGVGLLFQAESADESQSDFGALDFAASDVGAGTEDTYLDVLLRIAGGATLTNAYRLASTGTARIQLTHAAVTNRSHTIPDVADDTFALIAASQTLTTKTINLASNTLVTTLAQLNTAVSDADLCSLGGAETISGIKTFTANPAMSGAGRAITFDNLDSQIRLGGATDPGWTVPAVMLANGRGQAFYTTADIGPSIVGTNVYYDGTKRYTVSASAGELEIGNTTTFRTAVSGIAGNAITFVDEATITSSGMILGAPTGGAKGSGTLNATAVYDDNTLLTDWLFDLYYDGAARAGDLSYRGQSLYALDETERIARIERRLPWMPSRAMFEEERSLGAMISKLWQGQEQQQIYLFEHEGRLQKLERLLNA